jgi:hypothetical protein
MLEHIFKNKIGLKNMGSTTHINATIMPEKYWNCQRLEGKHAALQIALDIGNFRYTRLFFRL